MPQITINKEWLERLVEISEQVAMEKDPSNRNHKLNHLLGYIASAESMIKE